MQAFVFFAHFANASTKTFNNFKWILSPVRPIQNSNFDFTISFDYLGNHKPTVSFELDGCELIKKTEKIIQKSNKIIDGKFVTIKKMMYKYTFSTRSHGKFLIKKFKLVDQSNSKSLRQISFYVDKIFKKKPRYHFVGEVSKKDFFQGEGFNIDYYLYFKDYPLKNILI